VAVTLEESEALSLIRLQGAIDIGCAAELKKLLLQALGSGREVRVAQQGATDLDVTAVQLLWAAAREAKGAGVKFSLTGPASKEISAALGEAGLQQFMVPVTPDEQAR
jgi:anti-anti-sigma regulatory factor